MDVLEMALKTETDAIAFYTEAARKTSYPVGKKMFQAIIEDEKRHLEMIRKVVIGLHITHTDVSPMKNVKTASIMKRLLMLTDLKSRLSAGTITLKSA